MNGCHDPFLSQPPTHLEMKVLTARSRVAIALLALLPACESTVVEPPVPGAPTVSPPQVATVTEDPPPPAPKPTPKTPTTSTPLDPTTTTIRVRAPLDGARWAAGSLHWISWSGLAANASLEVTFDGGVSWSAAVVETASIYDPNTPRRHLWRVPNSALGMATFRAVSPDGTQVSPSVTIDVIPSQEVAYTWTHIVEDGGYVDRDGAALENFNGKLLLLGGWNPIDFATFTTNEIWASADGGQGWSFAEHAPWAPRHSFGHVVLDDKLFVLGGDALQGAYQPDVWSTTNAVDWQLETAAAPWGNRALHYAVAHAGALWVMGGQTVPQFFGLEDEPVYFNDVWRSVDGVSWTRVLEHAPWAPRGIVCGHAVLNGEMWLMGGGTYDTPQYPSRQEYSDAWSSKDGVAWTRHTDPPWFPRQYHDLANWDGRLWVTDGYTFLDDANHNDVWYSADGENWYEVPGTPWEPRHASGLTPTPNGLIMTSGAVHTTAVWALTRKP